MSHIITVIFTGIVYLTAGANPATPTSPFRVLIPNLKMHTVPGVPEHVAYLMFETADFDPVATKIGRPQLIFTDQFTRTTYGVVFLDNEDIQVRSIDSQFKIGMNPLKADTTGTLATPNSCCSNGQRSADVSYDERFDVAFIPTGKKACPSCGKLDTGAFSGGPDVVAGIFSVDRGKLAANFFTTNAAQRKATWYFKDKGGTQTHSQRMAPGLALDLVTDVDNTICLLLTSRANGAQRDICLGRADDKKINLLIGSTPFDDMLLLNRNVTKAHVDSHFGLYYQPGYLLSVDSTPIPQDFAGTKHGTGTNCPPLFVEVQ